MMTLDSGLLFWTVLSPFWHQCCCAECHTVSLTIEWTCGQFAAVRRSQSVADHFTRALWTRANRLVAVPPDIADD